MTEFLFHECADHFIENIILTFAFEMQPKEKKSLIYYSVH